MEVNIYLFNIGVQAKKRGIGRHLGAYPSTEGGGGALCCVMCLTVVSSNSSYEIKHLL